MYALDMYVIYIRSVIYIRGKTCKGIWCYMYEHFVWFCVGILLASAYVLYMFGRDNVAGDLPKHCALVNFSFSGCPLRLHDGSFYLIGLRMHHWTIFLCLLPFAAILRIYWLLGICIVMILHGLSYKDCLRFKYDLDIHKNPSSDQECVVGLSVMQESEPLFPVINFACGEGEKSNGMRKDTYNLAELQRLKLTILEDSDAPLLVRRSIYFILAGGLLYFVSWSTILCRVTRGIVRFPDRMPTPVWIATMGILVFYQLFIFAQCGAMLTRVREIFHAQTGMQSTISMFITHKWVTGYRDCMYLFLLLCASVPEWKSLAALACGVSLDLIAAVLYSIPPIRSFFGMPAAQQRAEPWATTCFLFLIWAVIIYISGNKEQAHLSTASDGSEIQPRSKCSSRAFVLIYMSISIITFFSWGFGVMRQLEGVSVVPWVIASVALVGFIVYSMTRLGIARMNSTLPDTGEVLVTPDELEERDRRAMLQLYNAHFYAMWFHICLVMFTLFIGLANSQSDWYTEYLGMSKPVFLFTTDWGTLEDLRDKQTVSQDKSVIGLGYCATSNALPLLLIPICCAWSLCSAFQHYVSANTLADQEDSVHSTQGNAEQTSAFVLATAFAMPAFYIHGITIKSLLFGAFMLVPSCIIVTIVYGGVWDMFDRCSDDTSTRANRLEKVSTYRWIEYTISASLMHIIVCYTAGIASSHELVLCVCCFGFSMLTTHLANSTLSRAENEEYTRANMNRKETEKSALFFKTVISTQTLHVSPCIRIRKTSGITVSTRVNTELPFIFLSFCAKGVLCIALTFPWVFADRRGVELQPLQCTL
jgi:hypothetical protein